MASWRAMCDDAGSPQQFAKVHAMVLAMLPNYFNLTRPISVKTRLKVE